jgi:hypothetical protein
MHHLLLKKITKTLGLGWFGVVYSRKLRTEGYSVSKGNWRYDDGGTIANLRPFDEV